MDRDAVLKGLKTFICQKILKRPGYPLTESEALLSNGFIDSHELVRIAVFVEKEWGVVIADADLTVDKMDTLGLMADLVLKELARPPAS